MGFYVNPSDGNDKRGWLLKNAELLGPSEGVSSAQPIHPRDCAPDELPVCLVDNGIFQAAAVCHSAAEFEHFTLPEDQRRKTWFKVKIQKLLQASDLDRLYSAKGYGAGDFNRNECATKSADRR